MLRNKSLKVHSRSNSTSAQHYQSKPSFRTLLKRRNETISASQLYQDHSLTLSQSKVMSQSQVLLKPQTQISKPKAVDIRQYVKKMGVKKEVEDVRMQIQRVKTQVTVEQNPRKTSRINFQYIQNVQQSKTADNKCKRTIEELQYKIQSFISQNMSLLKMQKKNIGLSKWSQLRKSCSRDKEIQDIYQYFNELSLQMAQNEQETQKLADLNKRIQMVQKMIACQCAQSELLKLQYYGWKNQRGNTSSFSSKKMLNTVSQLNRDNKPINFNRSHLQKPKEVSPLTSTAKNSFKKPDKNSYIISKQKKNSYSLNRQPIPRSSYSAQYLNYGYIPIYSYKPDTLRVSPETSLAIKASTYQQQYKEKLGLTHNTNFRELDCVKDKFKNTNISFMNCSKKPSFQSILNLKKKIKNNMYESAKQNSSLIITRNNSASQQGRFMNLTSTPGFYKTQTQKQFNWHNTIISKQNEDSLTSEIKDKKLIRLKQAFKNLAVRQQNDHSYYK